MEKKTSFMSLVYREYCITKKSILGNIIAVVITFAICIMYDMSAKFGNVAKAAANPDLSGMIGMITPMVRISALMVLYMPFCVSGEGAQIDLKNKTWTLFRKALPVRPFQLAMARVVYQLITFAASTVLSLIYVSADCIIIGKSIGRADLFDIVAIGLFWVLFSNFINLCVTFTRSTEKGTLMAMGATIALMIPFFVINSPDTEAMDIEQFRTLLYSYMDYTPLFIILIVLLFILEAVLLTLCYKRREK